VNVQNMVSTKTEPQNVQLVAKNVQSVPTCQKTVLSVLKEDTTHQPVQFYHQLPNPPKSKMSQSDQSKLSLVTVNVILVKSPVITV